MGITLQSRSLPFCDIVSNFCLFPRKAGQGGEMWLRKMTHSDIPPLLCGGAKYMASLNPARHRESPISPASSVRHLNYVSNLKRFALQRNKSIILICTKSSFLLRRALCARGFVLNAFFGSGLRVLYAKPVYITLLGYTRFILATLPQGTIIVWPR